MTVSKTEPKWTVVTGYKQIMPAMPIGMKLYPPATEQDIAEVMRLVSTLVSAERAAVQYEDEDTDCEKECSKARKAVEAALNRIGHRTP